MSAVLAFSVQQEITTCSMCGIDFSLPVHFKQTRREDGKTFYCPNGHGQVFSVTEVERLRRELEATTQRLEAQKREAAGQRELRRKAERLAKSRTTQVRNLKRKQVAGNCIKCSIHFDNLAEHMSSAHPKLKVLYADKEKSR